MYHGMRSARSTAVEGRHIRSGANSTGLILILSQLRNPLATRILVHGGLTVRNILRDFCWTTNAEGFSEVVRLKVCGKWCGRAELARSLRLPQSIRFARHGAGSIESVTYATTLNQVCATMRARSDVETCSPLTRPGAVRTSSTRPPETSIRNVAAAFIPRRVVSGTK